MIDLEYLVLIIKFLVAVIIIHILVNYMIELYMKRENKLHIQKKDRIVTKINHPSSELLELIGIGKEFNSLVFNDRGAFVIIERDIID